MKIETVNKNMEVLQVEGALTIMAFKSGVIPDLLKSGSSLTDAIAKARKTPNLVAERKRHNLVTSAGKGLVAKLLMDAESKGITFFAIGTGTTAAAITDTALGSEKARKQITSRSVSFATISFSTFMLASESAYAIQEIGYFGGAVAGMTPNSGILFSRIMQAYDNHLGLYDLTFEYTLTVS